jgi:hypothetical protein
MPTLLGTMIAGAPKVADPSLRLPGSRLWRPLKRVPEQVPGPGGRSRSRTRRAPVTQPRARSSVRYPGRHRSQTVQSHQDATWGSSRSPPPLTG